MNDENSTPETDGPQLRANPLVASLVASADAHEPLNVLTGLLGTGSRDDLWRLYLTLELDEYVEFERAAVVHTAAVQDGTPLAGTSVWLRIGTTLRYTQVSSAQVQADFLSGGITGGHFGGAVGSSLRGLAVRSETGFACTRNFVCSTNRHIPACQERTDLCGPGDPPGSTLCPTGPFVANCP